jgi:hypothetical protein
MDLLKAHFGGAAEHDDFVSLPFGVLLELVRLDDLRAPSEEAVLTAILRWIEHSESRCARCGPRALPAPLLDREL